MGTAVGTVKKRPAETRSFPTFVDPNLGFESPAAHGQKGRFQQLFTEIGFLFALIFLRK